MDFRGHVALVTGASSGIGAELAREISRRGGNVVAAARRLDRLETLAQELSRSGGSVLAVGCDVTRREDLDRCVSRAREVFGRLDTVIANAGFGVVGKFEDLTVEDYRRQFETNVFGVLQTAFAALDDLKKSRGRLVLIGSVAGFVPTPGSSPYSMSKFAVRALAGALRTELAPHGISVTHIAPGFIKSEIYQIDNAGSFSPRLEEPGARLDSHGYPPGRSPDRRSCREAPPGARRHHPREGDRIFAAPFPRGPSRGLFDRAGGAKEGSRAFSMSFAN